VRDRGFEVKVESVDDSFAERSGYFTVALVRSEC
jgi:hypothetical protein